MTHSQRKGARGENEGRDLIAEWWRQLEPECEFVRTPKSGGWATSKLRKDFQASGDLMTTAVRWPFCVEIKRREIAPSSYQRLVRGMSSAIWPWWKQAVNAATEMDAIPLLMWRRNREPWRVMLPKAWSLRWGVPGLDFFSGVMVKDRSWLHGVHPAVHTASVFFNTPPERVALREHAEEEEAAREAV